jgi:hypothetical protein
MKQRKLAGILSERRPEKFFAAQPEAEIGEREGPWMPVDDDELEIRKRLRLDGIYAGFKENL